jgi:aminoglycoside phosphotransferase
MEHSGMATTVINNITAGDLAAAAVGSRLVEVRRFRTGLHHYVYEASFANRAPVVVRIAGEQSRSALVGAFELSHRLRPLGVPMPRIIAEGLNHRFPHLVLARLPGADLGNVIRTLSDTRLEAIAMEVTRAQRITGNTGSAGRYGYAVDAADAPCGRWSQVLEDNLARSRSRIAAAGLFDISAVDAVAALVSSARAELDSLPPIPFLHDTTTKNVIVTSEGDFSGIVDVDDLCFGDPRYVVALTFAALTASGQSTHYVDAWMSFNDFPNDTLFRIYVALFIVDFMSEHGQAFNNNQRASSRDERDRLLQIFAERLQLAAV